MSHPVSLLTRAADFAARRHAGQTSKGAKRLPYIIYLTEVADLLATAAPDDIDLIAATYLHDVDAGCRGLAAELECWFDEAVMQAKAS